MGVSRFSLVFTGWYVLLTAMVVGAVVGLQWLEVKALGWSVALVPSVLMVYAIATLSLMAAFLINRDFLWRLVWWITLGGSVLAGGLMVSGVWENFQLLEQGHWGMSNLFEVRLLTLWTTGGIGAYYGRQGAVKIHLFLTPLLTLGALFLTWLGSLGVGAPQELVPALQNPILPFHVFTNFIAYACFFVAACAGALVLVQQGLQRSWVPEEQLDTLAARCVLVGFPLFSIAIVLGCIWAYQVWGGYWSWDPKETWALIVWLCYAGYLHARLTIGWGPTRMAVWAVVGFFITLFCYLGVNLFLDGLHSYGNLPV